MQEEIWRPVVGYEGLYEVSNLGRIRSIKRKKYHILRPAGGRTTYHKVSLYKGGKGKTHYVHRLTAIAFIPNPHLLPCINHKDERKYNNRAENLEWCTHLYNNNYGTAIDRGIKKKINNIATSIAIEQYTRDGNYVATYPSIMEAQRQTGICRESIRLVVSQSLKKTKIGDKIYYNKLKTAGGYIWKIKDESANNKKGITRKIKVANNR